MNNKKYNLKIVVCLVLISILLHGCISSPDNDKTPEAIETAGNMLSRGVHEYNLNDYKKARFYFRKALAVHRGIDNREGIASSCLNLAKTELALGNYDSATKYIQLAKTFTTTDALKHLDDLRRIIESSLYIQYSDYDEAEDVLSPLFVSERFETNSEQINMAVLQNRIRIGFAKNDSELNKLISEYEKLADRSDDTRSSHKARLLRFKAKLNKDGSEQNTQMKDALAIYRVKAHQPGIANTLKEWADMHTIRGDFATATDLLKRALFIRISMENRTHTTKILHSMLNVYDQQGLHNNKHQIEKWLKKLATKNFTEWEQLNAAFDTFPL